VPLSYLRRPLFVVLTLYMLALAVLHHWGVFTIWVPSWQLSWRQEPNLRLEGLAASPRREDLRGVKIELDDAWVQGERVGVKVLAYLPRDLPGLDAVRPGQRLALAGSMRLPRSARNPGDFDERVFMSDRGIGWIMKAESVEMLPEPVRWRWLILYWAEGVRLSMERCFASRLEDGDAKLMTGLTLGYKGPLPRELNRAIQDAGAMHLLVPSGAKVAFVLLGIAALCSWIGLPLWARLSIGALAGGFYTLMVGADPPYARAYLGALALGLGAWLDRESGAFQATVLSALMILLAEPRALFSAGFQMTYLAMTGLLLAMPRVDAALPEAWPRPLRGLICVGAVTLIVQLMLWPVFANTFGRAALLGAAANLPLVPLSGLILSAGFAFWGLAFMAPKPLVAHAAQGLELLLALFRWFCFKAAALPVAAVELSPMTAAGVSAYYLLAAALLVLPRRKAAAALAAGGLFVLAAAAAAARLRAPPVSVLYLSLREPAAVVSFADGRRWLVGPGAPAGTVRKALQALGVSRLDKTVSLAQEPGFSLCEKAVCFSFDPPAIRKGSEEFSTIKDRLKRSAVEASTDGSRIEIKDAAGGALH
jgi:ComEC/Rec2-related protein